MTAAPQERPQERSWHRRPESTWQAGVVPAQRQAQQPTGTTRRARRRARHGLLAALSALPWPTRAGRRRR